MRNMNAEKALVPENCTSTNIYSKQNEVLFIGYNYNYPNTIRHTLKEVNRNSDVILLDKNIELYITSELQEFNQLFKNIKSKIVKGKYKYLVFDVPNLNLNSDYSKTKKILEYLHTKGKLMIIINGPKHNFERIFGNLYSSNIIQKHYIVDCGNHSCTKDLIHSIL